MRRHLFNLLILFLLTVSIDAFAQPIVQGEQALNEGEYARAQEYFNIVIKDQSKVKPFELALAYYYRAWTWLKLYGTGPADITSPEADASGEMLLKAYDDLISSLTYEDGKLTQRINTLLIQLEPGLVQYGLVMVNRAEDHKASGKKYSEPAAMALTYLSDACSIKATFVSYDLLGQACLVAGNTEKALENFKLAEEDYRLRPPAEPDFMVGYAFFRAAVIYRDVLADEDRCLLTLQSGRKLLEDEFHRYFMAGPAGDSSRLNSLKITYIKVSQDLRTLELETYLQSATRLSEAQAEFKKEMALNPGDINLVIAYASMMEKTDPTVAIIYYEKALEIDPANEVAAYNVGAVNFNLGKKYFDQGVLEEDEEKAGIYIEEARKYFKKARPVFEDILEKHPDDEQAISTLKMICFALDDTKAFEYYSGLEKK
jgi:tetratricopeptide (TPR) repeat protein